MSTTKELIYSMIELVKEEIGDGFKALIGLKNIIIVFVLIGILLYLKWRHDKQIQVYCKKSMRNIALLQILTPLINQYSPTFWLPCAFLKTIYLGGSPMETLEIYVREEIELSDGGVVAIDLYPHDFHKFPKETPILFLVPGIVGTSRDQYISECCQDIYKSIGWRIAIFNRRGYGGVQIKVIEILNSRGEISQDITFTPTSKNALSSFLQNSLMLSDTS